VSKRAEWVIRVVGLDVAAASVAVSAYVVAKLYTGRGGDAPIRAAIYEQPLVALLGLAGLALGAWMVTRPREFAGARAWLNPRWVWRARRGEALLLVASAIIGALILEAGSRALYARDERLPFFYPTEYLVYPPLYHAMRDYSADTKNVLLLGGSVLMGAGRRGEMQEALGPGWRVYNVAQNAHSSLDSLTKYRWLVAHGYRFDYVVFYHGINEVRANNCPPDVFRDDYSHYLFYRLVHAVFDEGHPVQRWALRSALVYRADRLVAQLRNTRTFGRHFVTTSYPREDWLKYGAEIRSAGPFEANLMEIARLANAHGATLLVGEFFYDPVLDAYVDGREGAPSREAMVAYTREWGLPENVLKGIRAHNAVIREHRDGFVGVDTSAMRQHEKFIDPCHLTETANAEFVALMANALRERAD